MLMGVYYTASAGACHSGMASNGEVYTYTAWASALLVLLFRAMRRPQSVARAAGKVPTLFLVYATVHNHVSLDDTHR